MAVDISRLKHPLRIALIGLILGLIGDLMFYGNPLGISVPILTVAIVVALLGLAVSEKTPTTWANLWLAVPLLFLSVMYAVRAAPLLRFLNLSGTLILLGLLANGLTNPPLFSLNIGGYLGAMIETGFLSAIMPIPLIGHTLKTLSSKDTGARQTLRRTLIGLLIALPFLCVFTILFASADLLFGKYVGDILEAFNPLDLIGHTFLTLALAWPIIGGLIYALSRGREWRGLFAPKESQPADTLSEEAEPPRRRGLRGLMGMVETSVVLFSIDLLFLLFVGIQFAALFGGEAFLHSQGLTYSEYARRGFFELLAVSLITLGLILSLEMLSRRETTSQQVVFLLGSGIMIALTVFILASAFQRLGLYELAYGFTRLRLHTHVFMAWLAVLFGLLLLALVTRQIGRLATGILVAAVGFIITLDILNPDAFIAQRNLERYRQGETLDIAYLGSLSEDATPVLIPLLFSEDTEVRDRIGPWLHQHLIRLDIWQARVGWPAYHLSTDRAYRLLDANRALIESYDPDETWSDWPDLEY
jgi:hypothetical protein